MKNLSDENNKVKNENEQPRKIVIIDGKLIPISEIISFQERTKVKEDDEDVAMET